MKKMTFYARELRQKSTDAELLLWQLIRRRQLAGFKFRRQCTFDIYIVDFVCFERKVIIELDGSQHVDQQAYDANRTAFLNQRGFRVIRFWNSQVFESPIAVKEQILAALLRE